MSIASSFARKCSVVLPSGHARLAGLLGLLSAACGTSGGSASGTPDAAGPPPSVDASEAVAPPQDSSPPPDQSAPPAKDAATTDVIAAADSAGDSAPSVPFPFAPSFILGADISWVSQHEAEGYTYSDGTSVKPMEEIMANNGFNFIRLRTFVQPSASGGYAPGSAMQTGAPGYGTSTGGWCSTADTVAKAVRMKKCGLGVLVDFHMSDTWASIGGQTMPSSWVGLSQTVPTTPVSASTHDNNIYQAAHDYVAGVMQALVAAGAKPDMVQIGNETNSGMSGIDLDDPAAFVALVNAGVKAVRETDPAIIVWAQNGRPRPDSAGGDNFDGWVDDYLSGKSPYEPAIDEDGICGSTYGTTDNGADWTTCFTYVFSTYSKPVMSCEYTDQSPNGSGGSLINGIMHGFPSHYGRGSFNWEPADYGTTIFTLDTTTKLYTTNSLMTAYPTLAKSYGLPVPASTCSP